MEVDSTPPANASSSRETVHHVSIQLANTTDSDLDSTFSRSSVCQDRLIPPTVTIRRRSPPNNRRATIIYLVDPLFDLYYYRLANN